MRPQNVKGGVSPPPFSHSNQFLTREMGPRYEMDYDGWCYPTPKGQRGNGWHDQGKGHDKGKGQGKAQGKRTGVQNGKGQFGKGKGQGKYGKGKGKDRDPDAPPRGSYLVCGGDCMGYAYCDVAGATCRLCNKRWDWKAFWDQLAGRAAGGETQNAQGANPSQTRTEETNTAGAEIPTPVAAEEVVQVPDEKPEVETPSAAHAKAMAGLKECWKTVEKYDVQLKHESQQLLQMGGSLDTKIQAVKDQMQKMEAQAAAIKKVEAERAISFKSYTDKDSERATVWNNCSATISTKVAVAFPPLSAQAAAFVSPATLELLQNIPAVEKPAVSAEPQKPARDGPWAPNTINDRIVAACEAADNEGMDEEPWGFQDEGQDGVDSSSEEEDNGNPSATKRYLDNDFFREAMVSWAFYAQKDEEPPEDLMRWFSVWGTDNTTVDAAGNLLREGRDKFMEARRIAIQDKSHTTALENAGHHAQAQSLQMQSDMYSQERKDAIWGQLDEHLKVGLAELVAKRTRDLESGAATAPEQMEYKIVVPPHAKKAKGKGGKNAGGKGAKKATSTKKVKNEKNKAAAEVAKSGLQPANDGTDKALEASVKDLERATGSGNATANADGTA